MIYLNLAGFLLFCIGSYITGFYIRRVHPSLNTGFSFSFSSFSELVKFLFLLLVDLILLVIAHEGVHGLFFWLFTGSRPVFSIGPGYASAAAPTKFISKKPYLFTALSPLILLTLIGFVLVPVSPPAWLFYIGLFIVLNISGSVGDLWVVGRIFFQTEPLFMQDFGDRVLVYQKRKDAVP